MQSCDGIPKVWVGVVTVVVLIVDLSKGQGHFLPIEARSGPGLKLLLICPRQPVGQGFGSLSAVSQDISVMSAFLIVDLTFDGQPHLLQVRRRPPCSDGFPCFGSHPSLANGTGASFAVVGARCTGCSSKLCLSFGPFEPRPLQQRRLHELSWSRMVLKRDCAQGHPALCCV